MTTSNEINFSSIIGRNTLIIIMLVFVFIALSLSVIFIEIEAFEKLHEFSRSHEDWELDEFILIAVSMLMGFAVSSLVAVVIFGRRLMRLANARIAEERQYAQSRKLQSMGSLLGGLAHSLNNHLVPILTLSRLVRDGCPEHEDAFKDLSQVIRAAESAREMLAQVLNFTRQEERDIENKCVIDDTISIALDLAKAAIPSSVSLHCDMQPLPVTVPVSRLNIEIILLNLITNAVHAIEGSTGNIYVSLEALDAEFTKDGGAVNRVCIRVKDDGVGLTEEQKLRIFDPFYTTKPAGKGSGLGLSETYGIITAAGGTIEVDSVLGESTEFRLILPSINN